MEIDVIEDVVIALRRDADTNTQPDDL